MNAFVYTVKSCLEVSSRDCLIASDKRFRLLFRSWFRNPQKRTETRGKKFLKKTSFQVRAGPVKRTETRQGWENSRTLPYYGMMAASSLASKQGWENARRLPYICKKWAADVGWSSCVLSSLLGSQRGGRHHSVVGGVVEFSPLCLVSVLFIGPPLLEMKFFRNFSPTDYTTTYM